MKRFLTFLALLLTFSVSAQTFQVATKIVASPDCKLKFLNKIDSQIYEINSVDMTWQYLTTTTIKIKDYDNEVTIYKNNMTSPVFANIPALLDSVQGSCMGGPGGGVQSIVAGTNITVDDTDPQNPIISASGGGSATASNGNQIMDDGSVGLGGTLSKNTMINVSDTSYIRFNGDNYEANFAGSIVSIFNKGGIPSIIFNNDELRIDAKKGSLSTSDYVLMIDSVSNLLTQRRLVRLVPKSDFSGDGNYLPLHITEPTIVEIDSASYLQFGEDGNGFSIEKPVPLAFQGIAKTFTGVDHTDSNYQAIVGKVTGINVPQVGLSNTTLMGTLSLLGDVSSGDFIANVNGMNVVDGEGIESLNISVVFVGGNVASFKKMSIEPDAIFIQNNSFEIEINDVGMILNDDSDSLTITPASLLVPIPPNSGNYVLKSDNGVVSWELE